jgi:hypothetical protein
MDWTYCHNGYRKNGKKKEEKNNRVETNCSKKDW